MTVEIPYINNIDRIKTNYAEREVICPFCKSRVTPILKAAFTDGNQVESSLRFLAKFPCCNREHFITCDKVGYYYGLSISISSKSEWKVEELPKEIVHFKEVPDIINQISPNFKSIYEEAQEAKQLGYTQICGGGYRKALEFLIKDYAMLLHPDKKEEILTMALDNAIKQYVDNDVIKVYANRASWLGNDELHYRRTWVDKDIFDLEALIEASVMAIRIEEEGKRLEKEMPRPTKK